MIKGKNKGEEKMTSEKGITIVALIITIIIMLILAGVTLKGITQENGIINRAKDSEILTSLKDVDEALEQYNLLKIKEKIKQGDYRNDIDLEQLVEDGVLKKVEVEDTLRTIGIITDLNKIGIQGKLGKNGTNVEKNKEIISFNSTFAECRQITEIPENLFSNNTEVVEFGNIGSVGWGGTFCGCAAIKEIPQNLFDKNIEVNNFSYTFGFCGKLTTIPIGLFDNNTKVTTFEGCFKTCAMLEQIPQNLLKGKDTANTKSLFLDTKVSEDSMKNAGLTEEQIANAKI